MLINLLRMCLLHCVVLIITAFKAMYFRYATLCCHPSIFLSPEGLLTINILKCWTISMKYINLVLNIVFEAEIY